MDIEDNIRRRFTSLSKTTSRSISISSIALSCAYHLEIEYNNNFPDEIEVDLIDSSHLLYSNDVERRGNSVSKATDPGPTKSLQHILHDIPALNKAPKLQGKGSSINNTNTSLLQKDIINIQLSYDPNTSTREVLKIKEAFPNYYRPKS